MLLDRTRERATLYDVLDSAASRSKLDSGH